MFSGETLDELMKIIDDPTKSTLLKTKEVASVLYKAVSNLGGDLTQIQQQAEMTVEQGVSLQ